MSLTKGYLSPTGSRQGGVALVVILILLVVVTIVALAGIRYTSLELKISTNEEYRATLFQNVQSLIDATIGNAINLPVTGNAGDTNCTAGVTGCTQNTIVLLDGLFASEIAAGQASAIVTTTSPNLPVPRTLGYSFGCFNAASFVVSGSYDRSSAGAGKLQTDQGLLSIYANGSC